MKTAVAAAEPNEEFTPIELDQAIGAVLYLGRIHNALANLLDATAYTDDLFLWEYLNHLPESALVEILPGTALVLAEARTRLAGLQSALNGAVDSFAARVAADGDLPDDDDSEFAKIIHVEFGKKGDN